MVSSVAIELNKKVNKGDALLVLEAMKMQSTVYSPVSGVVKKLTAAPGQQVESKDLLMEIG